MKELTRFLNQAFWEATPGDYIAFVGIILGTMLLKKPLSRLMAHTTARIATRFSKQRYGQLSRALIHKPLEWLLAVILFFYAFNFIDAPLSRIILLHRRRGKTDVLATDVVDHLFTFFAIVFTTLLLSRIVDFLYRIQVEQANKEEELERIQLLPLLKDVIKIVVWTIGFFWLLGAVFHVNIPALIAGLGIGGVALALAAKESIENLLASFTILADKPFAVGDAVRLGSIEGKVARIGFRSTRLRSADGSLLIVPNKKLIDESLENLSGRDTRKMRLTVPVKNSIGEAAMQSLIVSVQAAVQATAGVQGTVNVAIDSFSEQAVQLAIVYNLPDALPEAQIQEVRRTVNQHVYELVADSLRAV